MERKKYTIDNNRSWIFPKKTIKEWSKEFRISTKQLIEFVNEDGCLNSLKHDVDLETIILIDQYDRLHRYWWETNPNVSHLPLNDYKLYDCRYLLSTPDAQVDLNNPRIHSFFNGINCKHCRDGIMDIINSQYGTVYFKCDKCDAQIVNNRVVRDYKKDPIRLKFIANRALNLHYNKLMTVDYPIEEIINLSTVIKSVYRLIESDKFNSKEIDYYNDMFDNLIKEYYELSKSNKEFSFSSCPVSNHLFTINGNEVKCNACGYSPKKDKWYKYIKKASFEENEALRKEDKMWNPPENEHNSVVGDNIDWKRENAYALGHGEQYDENQIDKYDNYWNLD